MGGGKEELEGEVGEGSNSQVVQVNYGTISAALDFTHQSTDAVDCPRSDRVGYLASYQLH